jgi:4-hydroxy-tetrahydrodipicolinate synthase
MSIIQGSIVAIVTPMKSGSGAETALDFDRLDTLLDFHVDSGTQGIVVAGTTGESATLSEVEHCELIEHVTRQINGRVPVIAGTGANSTHEAIRLTAFAKKANVDACLLVTPYYNKPTQEGLFLHHKAIAEAVDIPQILYNVPGRTACDMLPATVARLSATTNIIGIKEATGDISRVAEIRALCGPDFLLFSGDDATSCEFMLQGGNGVISVTANICPQKMFEMCAAALNNDRPSAINIDSYLQLLHQNLFVEANPIPVKWALGEMGLLDDGIRLPLTWLSPDKEKIVKEAMRHSGL